MVKSVQDGVCHNSARLVETMPLALELHREIQGRIRKAGPQGRVWSALIVMREPRPQSSSKMVLGQGYNPIETLPPKGPDESFAERIRLRASHGGGIRSEVAASLNC